MVSVCCKLGGVAKEEFGVEDAEKINPGTYEGACNPAAQAMALEREGSHLLAQWLLHQLRYILPQCACGQHRHPWRRNISGKSSI